mgnify:CR=1 FL=1
MRGAVLKTVGRDERLVGSSPALCVVSTLVQKPMSAMEEQKLAVGIINLLSANIISDGSRTV